MHLTADHIGPLDMFKVGVGPSSSHTVGPMVAALEFREQARQFLQTYREADLLHVQVELFGSLSATGIGHGTDGAVCAGLKGLHPRSADPDAIWAAKPDLEVNSSLDFEGFVCCFKPSEDLLWQGWTLDGQKLPHPNTMRFRLLNDQQVLFEQIILSVGGGFVETAAEHGKKHGAAEPVVTSAVPYPYNTASEFVEQCLAHKLPPWEIVLANEATLGRPENELREKLAVVLETMDKSIERGLSTEGILPGGLNVRRRARDLYQKVLSGDKPAWAGDDLRPSVYAMAVNEENAAGGRVVTAPTNGSSGIIPAVWRTLQERHNLSRITMQNGLIVASVIGALVKVHASISGAEVGCQGEVGTSCAMAAAGAVAMLGGTVEQCEQAAEMGIEHHLGMTCDPIKGLVQIPCIERNAMGAVKALNAAALALASDGSHIISLDKVLKVMKETGLDMNQKYKETATGGLALG